MAGINLMDDDRKSVAKMLLAQALDTSPAVWSQGMARAMAGLLAGLEQGEERRANRQVADALIGSGMPTAPAAAPMGTPDMTAPTPKPVPSGGGYSLPDMVKPSVMVQTNPNEMNFMDAQALGVKPPAQPGVQITTPDKPNFLDARAVDKVALADMLKRSPEDVDKSIRTIIGESAGEPPIGQQAVGSTLVNRANMAGTTPGQEATKPGQYEPWMTAGGRARMFRSSEDSPEYKNAQQALFTAEQNPIPATHFYSPGVQSALGRQPPKWDDGTGQMIGSQKFFNQPYAGQNPQVAQAQMQQAPVRADIEAPDRLVQLYRDPKTPDRVKEKIAPFVMQKMMEKPEWAQAINPVTGNITFYRKDDPRQQYTLPGNTAEQKGRETEAKETAEAQVKARQALPGAEAALAEAEKQVTALKTHPGRKWGLGSTAILGNIPTSSDAYAFKTRHEQALGGAFLAAYESLKGGGAIANAEGVKATTAKARMDRSTSAEEYDAALDDFISAVRRGVGAMKEQAGIKQEDNGGWQEFNGIKIRPKR